jgi:hypothetical protein
MRIQTVLFLTLSASRAACAGASTDTKDGDTDDVDDTDASYVPAETGDTGETDGGGDFVVTFDQGRYRVDALEIVAGVDKGVDLDGDGDIDNVIGTLLQNLGNYPSLNISLDFVNDNIAYALEGKQTIVLMEAVHPGAHDARLDVVVGQYDVIADTYSGDPASYDANHEPKQRLTGKFESETVFGTTTGVLSLPISFDASEPVITVSGQQVHTRVTIGRDGDEIDGFLAGAFPVKTVMDDIVAPLVQTLADNTGDTDAAAAMMELVASIVALQADIDKDTSDPKLSGTFKFHAIAEPWTDPPTP